MSWLAPSRSPRASRPVSLAVEILFAAALGALHSQAFAHTGAWWVQMLALVLLAWRVIPAGTARAAVIGLVFGTVWLAASTWWMYISLHDFGGLAAWMAALAVGLLCALLSLYLAGAMALFAKRRRHRILPDSLIFAAVWLLAELARGALFTGFPWAAAGYAHTSGPLAPLAPLVGVYGIGFASALVAALVAHALTAVAKGAARPASFVPAALAMIAVAAVGIAGPIRFSNATGMLSLTLLQTNVAQDEKFSAERMPAALDWLSSQLLSAKGDLVVAPETAIPLLPDQLAPQYWLPLLKHFHEGRQSALIGMPLGDIDKGYTNSAVGIARATASMGSASSGDAGIYRYDKHHLVPFGEFIPLGFRWFVDLMNIPLGDFARGPLAAPSFPVGTERIAPNICYEDLFGEELAARFVDASKAPTLFVNISNIAWFGNTVALHQHEEISRMRTLEFQRPMVRATNTGMTVVIDHAGVAQARLAPYTLGALNASVQGRQGITPFAYWAGVAGLWPLLLLALLIVGWPRRKIAAGPGRGATP
ncbi:apolipoprotein N-acyltransferase [soil metagenome]